MPLARRLTRRPALLLPVVALVVSLAGCGGVAAAGAGPAKSPAGPPARPAVSTIAPAISTAPHLTAPQSRPTPSGPTCSARSVTLTLTTDHPRYAPGRPVRLTILARSRSRLPCTIATGSCVPNLAITGPSGVPIWNRATTQVLCTFGRPRRLTFHAVAVRSIVWDGRRCTGRTPADCPGTPAPPGLYWVTARWPGLAESSVAFTIAR